MSQSLPYTAYNLDLGLAPALLSAVWRNFEFSRFLTLKSALWIRTLHEQCFLLIKAYMMSTIWHLQTSCHSQGGLDYICATAERFFAVSAVLNNMVQVLPENPSVRLLKHIIRCYLRLSDNQRAREALRTCLPPLLMDLGFTSCLKEDMQTRG